MKLRKKNIGSSTNYSMSYDSRHTNLYLTNDV